jgi:translation elongation factor EF-G
MTKRLNPCAATTPPDHQKVIVSTPDFYMGDVVAEVRKWGSLETMDVGGNVCTVTALLPVVQVEHFRNALNKITEGTASVDLAG